VGVHFLLVMCTFTRFVFDIAFTSCGVLSSDGICKFVFYCCNLQLLYVMMGAEVMKWLAKEVKPLGN
jgi:hypothetical protein